MPLYPGASASTRALATPGLPGIMLQMKILGAWSHAKNPDEPLAPQLVAAMAELGHEVVTLDNYGIRAALGQQGLQEALAEAVAFYRPDVLWLLCPYDELDRTFLDDLRSEGLLILSTSGDDELYHPGYRQDSRLEAWIQRHYHGLDVVGVNSRFVCEAGQRSGSARFFHVPQAIDPRPFLATEPGDPLYDVSFVGQAYPERIAMIRHLVAAGLPVALFGRGWDQVPDLAPHAHGFVTTETMKQVFARSRINLSFCLAAGSSGMVHSKARTYEIAACGGFQISTWDPELATCFEPETEIAFYRDADDLVAQIRHHLAQPELTRAAGLASRQRVFRDHTHAQRLRPLFEHLAALRAMRPLRERTVMPLPRLLPLAHLKVGEAKLASGNPEWARQEFRAGLALAPENQDLRLQLARAESLLGNHEAAQEGYHEALTRQPFCWSSSSPNPLAEAVWWLLGADLQQGEPQNLHRVFPSVLQDARLTHSVIERLEQQQKHDWVVELACSVPLSQLTEALLGSTLHRIGEAAVLTVGEPLATDFFRAALERGDTTPALADRIQAAAALDPGDTPAILLALPSQPGDEWRLLAPYIEAFRGHEGASLVLLYDLASGVSSEAIEERLMQLLAEHHLDPETIPDVLVEVAPMNGALLAGWVRRASVMLPGDGPWDELAGRLAEARQIPRPAHLELATLQAINQALR